jgi:tetratricopeptide (TPR) repeat protein
MKPWPHTAALLFGISLSFALAEPTPSPSAQTTKIAGLLREALSLKSANQHEAALALLKKAEDLAPNSATIHNVKGAIYADLRDFSKARECFLKAQAVQPRDSHAAFNLAEMDLVEGKYEAAQRAFAKLLDTFPNTSPSFAQVVRFKGIVCLLKLDKVSEATEKRNAAAFPDRSPAEYYTHIAFASQKGDIAAKDEWVTKARTAFETKQAAPYVDTLVEAKMLNAGDWSAGTGQSSTSASSLPSTTPFLPTPPSFAPPPPPVLK